MMMITTMATVAAITVVIADPVADTVAPVAVPVAVLVPKVREEFRSLGEVEVRSGCDWKWVGCGEGG